MNAPVGILGGTFDPIHIGHLAIADEARVALGLSRVILIPAAHQPLKQGFHGATPQQRLIMAELACQSNAGLDVSPIEVQRPGPSYTVDTLEQLHAQGLRNLYFIVGADALMDLPRWKAAERIVDLARIVAIGRPGREVDTAAIVERVPGLAGRLELLEGPAIDLSSTELRQRIAAGRPIRYLVPDAVAAYIAEHRLYRS
jgi:nicotinate-nucleotide adenylyltransferase